MSNVDVTIHINETVDSETRLHIENHLSRLAGVISPRFNLPHLMVVQYDNEKTSATALLHSVRDAGYQAQLVGL